MIDPNELTLLRDTLTRLAEGYTRLPEFQMDFDCEATAVSVAD